jgi:hypothetical protein
MYTWNRSSGIAAAFNLLRNFTHCDLNYELGMARHFFSVGGLVMIPNFYL